MIVVIDRWTAVSGIAARSWRLTRFQLLVDHATIDYTKLDKIVGRILPVKCLCVCFDVNCPRKYPYYLPIFKRRCSGSTGRGHHVMYLSHSRLSGSTKESFKNSLTFRVKRMLS